MTGRAVKILAVDDDATWLEQLPLIFENQNIEIHAFANIDQALIAIENTFYDIALLDLNFIGDHRTGLDVFRCISIKDSSVDVIVISGETDPKRLIDIMNAGITHFLPKPVGVEEIRSAVETVIRTRDIKGQSMLIQSKFSGLVGSSPLAQRLKKDIMQAARSGAKDILLQGETGTGKEVVARAIADYADTSGRLFTVHCAAINDGIAESELFGHVRGAYTGADKDRVGVFESTQGGFVFLDEIGDMPLNQQAKLLRVLQERKVQRVGSLEEKSVSFKSISASHVDLIRAVEAKRFREDLYYRIAKVDIRLPSLRERLEDIPELVAHFLATKSNNRVTITPQAVELLYTYHWPGNIRQLQSAIDSMVYRCEKSIIREKDVCAAIPEIAKLYERKPSSFLGKTGQAVISQERRRFQSAIAEAKGDREKAAALLKISRATFFRRAKELGLTSSRTTDR